MGAQRVAGLSACSGHDLVGAVRIGSATPPVSDRAGVSAARAWVAQPDEAEVVAALLVGFRDHLGYDWPSAKAFLAGVERLFEDPDAEFLLAMPDNDSPPAGVLQLRLRFSVWKAAPDAWIEDLFVNADSRRRGLGAALLTLAAEVGVQRGAKRVELSTNEDNAAALALYERHGFSARSKGTGRHLFLGRPLA